MQSFWKWLLIAFNALMIYALFAGLWEVSDDCEGFSGQRLEDCETALGIGATIGIGGLVFVWVIGDIILYIPYAISKPKEPKAPVTPLAQAQRECPHCKEGMRRDASVCPHCQRDSTPWRFHDGRWWSEQEGTWWWLDERKNEWNQFATGPGPRTGSA